ncbi:hypothetical protein BDM02DRAFT_3127854 [Thelephora ganbajun]|uniref:Uncharacterized protein n=1 Tax=Thelephora ganbajun TaxID=370292 RepID=A0ACB6ZLF0_THEGA|nr:hypothetical protein BDM02DRAFT_3127854 [Thelephora ganbajun]
MVVSSGFWHGCRFWWVWVLVGMGIMGIGWCRLDKGSMPHWPVGQTITPQWPNIHPHWILFSSCNKVVTASSTIDDLMDNLVQCQVIPADYHDVYTLSYHCVGLLWGSSTIASLGAGSLSHFYLQTCVCGGADIVWCQMKMFGTIQTQGL